jgi:hypothetical protein
MHRKRADSNQAALVLELRTAGYTVHDYLEAGYGVPDIVMCKGTHCEWVEIKASRRSNLTDAERAFFAICPGGPPILAWTAPLAMAEFERRYRATLMPCGHPRSAVVSAAEGTAYCGACEREAGETVPHWIAAQRHDPRCSTSPSQVGDGVIIVSPWVRAADGEAGQ